MATTVQRDAFNESPSYLLRLPAPPNAQKGERGNRTIGRFPSARP